VTEAELDAVSEHVCPPFVNDTLIVPEAPAIVTDSVEDTDEEVWLSDRVADKLDFTVLEML
jgi:hypothetical protein